MTTFRCAVCEFPLTKVELSKDVTLEVLAVYPHGTSDLYDGGKIEAYRCRQCNAGVYVSDGS
jgi:phage FluMu protein Com